MILLSDDGTSPDMTLLKLSITVSIYISVMGLEYVIADPNDLRIMGTGCQMISKCEYCLEM